MEDEILIASSQPIPIPGKNSISYKEDLHELCNALRCWVIGEDADIELFPILHQNFIEFNYIEPVTRLNCFRFSLTEFKPLFFPPDRNEIKYKNTQLISNREWEIYPNTVVLKCRDSKISYETVLNFISQKLREYSEEIESQWFQLNQNIPRYILTRIYRLGNSYMLQIDKL